MRSNALRSRSYTCNGIYIQDAYRIKQRPCSMCVVCRICVIYEHFSVQRSGVSHSNIDIMYTRGEKTKTCTRIVRLFVRCIFKTISTKLLIFIFKYIYFVGCCCVCGCDCCCCGCCCCRCCCWCYSEALTFSINHRWTFSFWKHLLFLGLNRSYENEWSRIYFVVVHHTFVMCSKDTLLSLAARRTMYNYKCDL